MTPLEQRIKERIRKEGPITFAVFMEMALYGEPGGYYASSLATVGAEGDFYTSPTAHPVFGALIALQLEQMWRLLGSPRRFAVIEMGAGKGLLGRDIMRHGQRLSPSFRDACHYIAIDRGVAKYLGDSEPLGERASYLRALVAPGPDPGQGKRLPLRGVVGCFLSNELLDAFPVHRVMVKDGQLQEIYVALDGDALVEILGEPSTQLIEGRLRDEGVFIPEGCQGEVNLTIDPWMAEVSQALERGFVLTIDYGYPAPELYSARRPRGTFMCHYRHTTNEEPYIRIGKQDITSHVDFTAVTMAGERNGLELCGLTTQRQFLLNLGFRAFVDALHFQKLPPLAYEANRMGMMDLIKPQGLGGFKALLQAKGISSEELYGLRADNPLTTQLKAQRESLRVPLLSQEHVAIFQAKHPEIPWDAFGSDDGWG